MFYCENEDFRESNAVKDALEASGSVFRYCMFESANLEGGTFGDAYLFCVFRDIEFYWGMFSVAVFANCRFERCTFRGTNFASCKLMECTFTDCRFLKDNLDSLCVAPDTRLYACVAENCEGWAELFTNRLD